MIKDTDILIPIPQIVKDPTSEEYEHPVKARLTASGAISLTDGYDVVYLYPEQVQALRDFLNTH